MLYLWLFFIKLKNHIFFKGSKQMNRWRWTGNHCHYLISSQSFKRWCFYLHTLQYKLCMCDVLDSWDGRWYLEERGNTNTLTFWKAALCSRQKSHSAPYILHILPIHISWSKHKERIRSPSGAESDQMAHGNWTHLVSPNILWGFSGVTFNSFFFVFVIVDTHLWINLLLKILKAFLTR